MRIRQPNGKKLTGVGTVIVFRFQEQISDTHTFRNPSHRANSVNVVRNLLNSRESFILQL